MKIDIGTVLNKFDDTVDEVSSIVKEYGIRFITADGRLRTMRGRKNVKSPKQQLDKPLDPRGGVQWNLQANGTMLVHDLDIAEPRACKVAMFCGFKDFNSSTWLTVFH
jgi:hypothetical protein